MNDTLSDHHFPCDTCGSDLRFAPDAGMLVCDHCGQAEPVDTGAGTITAIRELDFQDAVSINQSEVDIQESRRLSCPNCSAQFEISEEKHAAECPFCATPVVTETGLHRQIKPRGVVPFTLTEDAGRSAMNKWLGSLWFAPSGLQEYARKGRRMQGIYVPYWTYDADTKSAYRGERGTAYYVSRTVRRDGKNKTVRVRKIKWRAVSGRVARYFDDVLVLASQSLPKDHTDALLPWDLARLEPYQPEYLAGFRAEAYTIGLEDGYRAARHQMDRTILRDVKFDIGGDQQRVHDVDTTFSNVTFKHILLPVWLAAYRYRGKTYQFVVNGQTGRVQGERPWSIWKLSGAALLIALLAAVGGYLYAQYGG